MLLRNGANIDNLADDAVVNTSNFDGGLSSSEDNVQKALDALDDLTPGNLKADGSVAMAGTLDMDSNDIKNASVITFDTEYDNGTKDDAFTIDWNNGQKQKVVLNSADMVITFTDPVGPGNFMLKLIQDGDTGSRTVTWPVGTAFSDSITPTLSTAASAIDLAAVYFDGSNYFVIVTPVGVPA